MMTKNARSRANDDNYNEVLITIFSLLQKLFVFSFKTLEQNVVHYVQKAV
jgi:hypothetical protein